MDQRFAVEMVAIKIFKERNPSRHWSTYQDRNLFRKEAIVLLNEAIEFPINAEEPTVTLSELDKLAKKPIVRRKKVAA